MHARYIILPLLLLASAAQAIEPSAQLKDYHGLTTLLKANGVAPNKLQWAPIEAMCLSLKEEGNHIPYNQCRFDKALDQTTFASDRDDCEADAKAYYPADRKHPKPTVITATTTGSTNETTTATVTEPAMSASQLRATRRSVYAHCMKDLGWVSTSNWQLGRVSQ